MAEAVTETALTHVHEIPVSYGGANGPDLDAVAEACQCSAAEVVERHAATVYRVYMLGFVPGFAYLGRVDPRITVPRHRVPRERVPAGSVGIAGEQTGVYPVESPGGWQLIGRTATLMFDPNRRSGQPARGRRGCAVRAAMTSAGVLRVVKPGLLSTVQDLGRWGHQASGVPVAGPMDLCSHRLANYLAGNTPDAATIEITLIGPELIVDADTVLSVCGADFDLTCDGETVAIGVSFPVRRGQTVRFGRRRGGARAYLGVAGGGVLAAAGARQSRDPPGEPHGRPGRTRADRR